MCSSATSFYDGSVVSARDIYSFERVDISSLFVFSLQDGVLSQKDAQQSFCPHYRLLMVHPDQPVLSFWEDQVDREQMWEVELLTMHGNKAFLYFGHLRTLRGNKEPEKPARYSFRFLFTAHSVLLIHRQESSSITERQMCHKVVCRDCGKYTWEGIAPICDLVSFSFFCIPTVC